jgi:hypothetical protein
MLVKDSEAFVERWLPPETRFCTNRSGTPYINLRPGCWTVMAYLN